MNAGEEDICWTRTSACREILNVDLCVIKKRVSICLLILLKKRVNLAVDRQRYICIYLLGIGGVDFCKGQSTVNARKRC